MTDNPDAGQFPGRAFDYVATAVCGTVINYDYFEDIRTEFLAQHLIKRSESGSYGVHFVEAWNYKGKGKGAMITDHRLRQGI
jgi:hypothetical protein